MAQNLTEELAPAKHKEIVPLVAKEINQEPKQEQPKTEPETDPLTPEESTSDPIHEKEVIEPPKQAGQKSDILITPSLGSIDDLLSQTREELKAIPAEKLDLDIDTIHEVWKSYSNSVESLSTKSTLELVKIEVVYKKIQISVPSSVSKEEIIQEADLFQNLRDRFNDKMLEIVVIIDRDQFPELAETQTKQIFTMKEKYAHLKNKNQKLDLFVKTMNLKIDQE